MNVENYQLRAAVYHVGANHYVAVGKRLDKWFLFNDVNFTEVQEKEIDFNTLTILIYEASP
jgi:Ubiquitin carboxyl-terminal hydrolase